jgi:hypothetical protein
MNNLPVKSTPGGRYLLIRLPVLTRAHLRRFLWALTWLLLGGGLGLGTIRLQPLPLAAPSSAASLYLLDQAGLHLRDTAAFGQRVRRMARDLSVPSAWLMAVMYAESGFDPSITNRQGSGAVGLIQFMPLTAGELQVSPASLRKMDALAQLDYVQAYFEQVQRRYGPYRSLTDLYLGVLYPKARGRAPCYTLYARPSQSYRQNAGLDENRDGKVTVFDVDRRMLRLFPEAYVALVSEQRAS